MFSGKNLNIMIINIVIIRKHIHIRLFYFVGKERKFKATLVPNKQLVSIAGYEASRLAVSLLCVTMAAAPKH